MQCKIVVTNHMYSLSSILIGAFFTQDAHEDQLLNVCMLHYVV